jgi:hypothetical protein
MDTVYQGKPHGKQILLTPLVFAASIGHFIWEIFVPGAAASGFDFKGLTYACSVKPFEVVWQ